MCAKSLQLWLTLCHGMDCIPPGCSVHGILPTRILEWVAMPSSRGSSWPRDWTQVSHMAGGFFFFFYRLSHQGSPRILDWVAYPFSRGTSQPRNRIKVSCIAGRLPTELPGKPFIMYRCYWSFSTSEENKEDEATSPGSYLLIPLFMY